jgi:hypothetical protein
MTWDDAGDRAVILDAEGSTLVTLNPVGTLVWHELDEPCDTAALVERISERFPDVPPQQVREDVEGFVASLVAEGLLVAHAEIS